MKKILTTGKGFTLIELMIVVAIIGILAAIAIPNFMNYQCKAKQAEAKTLLGSLRVAQEAYFAEHDAYSDDLGALGFGVKGESRYTITIALNEDANGFTATATAPLKGEDNPDTWTMDEEGELINTNNACTN